MSDPLTVQTHTDALEELLAAAAALLDTCTDYRTGRATECVPEYVPIHEQWAEDGLKLAVANTRAVLNAGGAA